MINKEIYKHINEIPGSPSLYEVQKLAHCGTDHFIEIRKVTLKNMDVHFSFLSRGIVL